MLHPLMRVAGDISSPLSLASPSSSALRTCLPHFVFVAPLSPMGRQVASYPARAPHACRPHTLLVVPPSSAGEQVAHSVSMLVLRTCLPRSTLSKPLSY